MIKDYRLKIVEYIKRLNFQRYAFALKKADFNLANFKKLVTNKKFLVASLISVYSVLWLIGFVFIDKQQKLQLTTLPYQEKVADGVYKLMNQDPIHQVLAEGKKADLNLKENPKAVVIASKAKQSQGKSDGIATPTARNDNTEVYKWSVVNANGTRFEFGAVTKDTPKDKVMPVVRVTNSAGWFVRYQPRIMNQESGIKNKDENTTEQNHDSSFIIHNSVVPKVKGNVISWEISKGITAKYTMMQDRVKEDVIVDNPDALCGLDKISADSKQINTDSSLLGMFGSLGFSEEDEIHQQQYNQKQGGRDLGSIGQIDKVFGIHSDSSLSSIFTEKIKNTIPNMISFVNRISPEKVPMLTKLGVINATPNHPAAKFVKSPERTLSIDAFKNMFIPKAYAIDKINTDPKSADIHGSNQRKSLPCVSPRLDFDVTTGNNKSEAQNPKSETNTKYQIQNTKYSLKGELMPGGDIDWYTEPLGDSGPVQTQFTFPKPIITDANKNANGKQINANKDISINSQDQNSDTNSHNTIRSEYDFKKIGTGEYNLSIALDKEDLESATWPLTIDPVVIDAAANVLGTAYGNGRKILRDAWGNLIAFIYSGTGDDNVWYKNYNSTAWTDGNINLNEAAAATSEIAADLDSTGSAHLAFTNSGADIVLKYMPLKITRDGNNAISSLGTQAHFSLDTVGTLALRPSLIIANKGGGAGVEKIAVAYRKNGTNRGEIHFMQCDVADNCATAANWKNASEEINGSGTCNDTATSGAAGLPNGACKGTADKILGTVTTTTHHAVLTQMPGKPKRSPASVKKDINGSFTDLSNTIDNNTGTTDDVNSLTTTDYIYVGDNKPFSKITFDMTANNVSPNTFSTREYWNGASWVTVSNFVDNTNSAGTLVEDGSILFDEPSNWVVTSVNSVSKYWVRFRPSGSLSNPTTIAEIYINDRNSKALMVVGGVNSTNDLGASYIPWDEVSNAGWENNPSAVGVPWRDGIIALSTTGFSSTTFTNFVLSATTDYINNLTYVGYMEGTAVGSSNITIKYVPNNKDVTVAASWTDAGLPAMTEAADTSLSLTSDGSDIYMFYVLDAGTNSLVFRRCTGSGGGVGGICDNSADWGSEKTLDNTTDVSHPQAVVTKVTGDTIAIDAIYTMPTALDVVYERHYVDLTDKTVTVAASGDDAWQRDCTSGDPEDDQMITDTTVELGGSSDDSPLCTASAYRHVGFRFPNVAVAQGAAISSAYIDIRESTYSQDLVFTIYGEDVDNASQFAAFTNNCDATCIARRTRTTSNYSNSFKFATNTYRLDVTKIVQEIVCRGAANSQPCVGDFNGSGTWASGNALAILMISTLAADKHALFVAQDDATATMLDPTLQINVASSSNTKSPGTMADDATVGTVTWSNVDNAKTSDNSYATANGQAVNSHYLKATNFGFSIPTSATVNGITVEIERYQGAGINKDVAVKIVKSDGTIGTINKADLTTIWPTTDTYKSYGSSTDLWGESWAVSDINDPDFGVVLEVYMEYTPCLNENSLISTPNGYVKIKDIKVGDSVFSYNGVTKTIELKKVTGVWSHPISDAENKYFYIYYNNGKIIKATGNHRFYVDGNYVEAKDLKVGDKLLSYDLQEQPIEKIEIVENTEDTVWDFTVEDNHNFFANNILVHNPSNTSSVDIIRITVSYTLGGGITSYSLGSATQLATGSASFANLDHPFSSSEYGAVASDDTDYAQVSATTNYASQSAMPAFMFKVNNSNNNNTDKIDASAVVRSTLATSDKPVYLQVYRGGSTNDWVTMASNNNTAADNDITLTSPTISANTNEYYFVSGNSYTATSVTNPVTMADDVTVGTVAWTNPDNAKTSDDSYSTATGQNVQTHYIKATNFGFNIPSTAVITGIKAEIERKGNGTGTCPSIDIATKIVKADGTIGTTNKADLITKWPTTDTYKSYGSSSDLWGESWISSNINDPDFGVVLQADTGTVGCANSLNEDSLISTPNGNVKIRDIKNNDSVYSFNSVTKQREIKRVTDVLSNPISQDGNKYYYIYYNNGRLIKATGNHRFYIEGNYVEAKDLKVGDELLSSDLQEQPIEKIEIVENTQDTVWDLTVEDNHNFFANDILVHNVFNDATLSVDHIRMTVYYNTDDMWSYWRVYQDHPITTFNDVLSVDYVNVAYSPQGPDKVAFSNSARTLGRGACNGAASVFTMELQNGTTPTNPSQSTVVRVTSDSDSYVIYSDDTCATPVTNGDFTYTTSENSKNVYIIDSGSSGGTKTLTGTRQSGDTLTTGTQNYTLNGPDKVVFSNGARTLTAAACNGAASVFTMEIQAGSTPVIPFASTVVRVTSNSTGYTIYSDDTCTTSVTNGDFTYTTAQNTKSVYIIDNKKSITTRTLTGTRQSGDTLTTGTQNYTVNAGAVSKLVITLPGETFTDSVGNSGTASHKAIGVRFPIQINATDANFNLVTSYTGDKTLVFAGPGVGTSTPKALDKNNAAVNYGSNTTITFASGNAANIGTTLYKAESTTITATDGGSYGNASATLTIDSSNSSIKGGVRIRGGSKIQ